MQFANIYVYEYYGKNNWKTQHIAGINQQTLKNVEKLRNKLIDLEPLQLTKSDKVNS